MPKDSWRSSDRRKKIRKAHDAERSEFVRDRAVQQVEKTQTGAPPCPRCRWPMVKRVNGKTGEPFYGCPQYPICTGSRPILAQKPAPQQKQHGKRKKGRRKSARGHDMKDVCRAVIGAFSEIIEEAGNLRLSVRYSEVRCSRRVVTLHFMVDCRDLGIRVLNWWPGNGKFTSPITGESGEVHDWRAVLALAKDLADGAHADREADLTVGSAERHLDSIAKEKRQEHLDKKRASAV